MRIGPQMDAEYHPEHVGSGAHRAATLGCRGVLVAGGLGLGLLARGPLGQLGAGTADTPDVGLVVAALPLLVVAVCFVASGLRLDRALNGATKWRWAAAVLLVCALAPFDQLGAFGLVINLVLGSAVAVVVYAAHAEGRVRHRRQVDRASP